MKLRIKAQKNSGYWSWIACSLVISASKSNLNPSPLSVDGVVDVDGDVVVVRGAAGAISTMATNNNSENTVNADRPDIVITRAAR